MTDWEKRRDEEAALFIGNNGDYSFCCGVDWSHDFLFKDQLALNAEMLSVIDFMYDVLMGKRMRTGLLEEIIKVREKARGLG